MLNSQDIVKLMHKTKSESGTFSQTDLKEFEDILKSCETYIKNNSKKSSAIDNDVKATEISRNLIGDFVKNLVHENIQVRDFTDSEGVVRLEKELVDEILKYKAITDLMENKEVGEIRINSYRTIYFEKRGKIYRSDKIFKSVEELQKVLEKLLGDGKALNLANQFVNSRTPEGYRINATDRSISPISYPDGTEGDYTAVIRKFKKKDEKMKLEDIVKGRSLSDNMANLLKILVQARFSFLTVGGTGSGKTVTNEIIVSHINPMDRQVYIENPVELTPGIDAAIINFASSPELIQRIKERNYSEIETIIIGNRPLKDRNTFSVNLVVSYVGGKDFKDNILLRDFPEIGEASIKEENGMFLNDFIQMEANSEKENPTPKDPTPNNLIENALRQTPVWIIMGQCRSDEEFVSLLKAAQTGHKVVTTYHAENPEDAVRRYLMAYMAKAGNVPAELVLQNICSAFKFIINVEKLMDGSRKVMYITEIRGSEGLKPKLVDIYKYRLDKVEEDKTIVGRHRRTGIISERTVEQLRKMGIPDKMFEIYLGEVPENDSVEKETYMGAY